MHEFFDSQEIIGLYFIDSYKRFSANTFVNLTDKSISNYNAPSEGYDLEVKYKNDKRGSFKDRLGAAGFNPDINIRCIIGNNGCGKTTILDIIRFFLIGNPFKVDFNLKISFEGRNKTADSSTFFSYRLEDIPVIFITNFEIQKGTKRISRVTNFQKIETGHKDKFDISDFLDSQNKFDYFSDTVFFQSLNLVKDPNDIIKTVRIKTHSETGASEKTKNERKRVLFDLLDYISRDYEVTKTESDLTRDETISNFEIFEFIKNYLKNNGCDPKIFFSFWVYFYLSWLVKPYSTGSDESIADAVKKTNFSKKYQTATESLYALYSRKMDAIEYPSLAMGYKEVFKASRGFVTSFNNGIAAAIQYRKDLEQDFRLPVSVFQYLSDRFKLKIETEYHDMVNRKEPSYDYFEFSMPEFNRAIGREVNLWWNDNFLLEKGIKFKVESKTNPQSAYSLLTGFTDLSKYVSIQDLSSGEKQMIELIKHLSTLSHANGTPIVLTIDEPERSLHLEWQRSFLYFFLRSLSVFLKDRKIFLFIATHSPFIISDLPDSNVIFLDRSREKGFLKEGTKTSTFSKIKDSAGVLINNTFCANIPELIRSGFFINSPFGELSNTMINSAIKRGDFGELKNLADISGDRYLFEYLVFSSEGPSQQNKSLNH